jgi:small subunit ribosomal protein S34
MKVVAVPARRTRKRLFSLPVYLMAIRLQGASKALRVLESFLPQLPPPSLDTSTGNLYQVLSRYPQDGVGIRVSQTRWGQKGISNSYWLVTRTKLKLEGQHGRAWGKLYWKGEYFVGCSADHTCVLYAI